MVQLVTMTEPEYQSWLEKLLENYAQEHVAAGNWTAEDAPQKAKEQIMQLLPEGNQTRDQYLYTIVAEDIQQNVGVLWFGKLQRHGGKLRAFVYDIEIAEPYRQRGYASQAFKELEKKVLTLDLHEIELHVFGSNHAARAMYEKLGYQTTDVQMVKSLSEKGL